jgi:MFS transporter, DHA1 family, multidrug resistance protein
MDDLGVSLSQFSYYQGILALVSAVGSILSGLIIVNMTERRCCISQFKFVWGSMLIAIVAFLDIKIPLLITFAFLVFIISGIIHNTILYPICLNLMPHAKGRVTAILQGFSLISMAVVIELSGYCYRGSFQNIGIIRPLSKLAPTNKVQGVYGAEDRNVLEVHEDLNTGGDAAI